MNEPKILEMLAIDMNLEHFLAKEPHNVLSVTQTLSVSWVKPRLTRGFTGGL
jgi:hypothetical protein